MTAPFPTEAERLRAREAYVTIQHAGCQNEATTIEAAGTVMDCEYCKDDGAVFDNYYPPQPDAPKWPVMSSDGVTGKADPTIQTFNAPTNSVAPDA